MVCKESIDPTPYAVHCPTHGKVYLTSDEYDQQMNRPNNRWSCPRMSGLGECEEVCNWDDDNFETLMEQGN